MRSTQNLRRSPSRDLYVGVGVLIVGAVLILAGVFAPQGFGGRAPFGNIFTILIGGGGLIFGVSYLITSMRQRRAARRLEIEAKQSYQHTHESGPAFESARAEASSAAREAFRDTRPAEGQAQPPRHNA